MEECARHLRAELTEPLLEVLYGTDERHAGLIHHTAYTQPALFAIEYGLAQLWRSWGIEPAAVAGHSIGEYVAATVGGVMDLEDALQLIAARGRLMGELPAGGAMVVVFADEARVPTPIAPDRALVGIAAVNGPATTVISGDGAAIDAIVASLDADGIAHRPLKVSHAFHSPLMAPDGGRLRRPCRRGELPSPGGGVHLVGHRRRRVGRPGPAWLLARPCPRHGPLRRHRSRCARPGSSTSWRSGRRRRCSA